MSALKSIENELRHEMIVSGGSNTIFNGLIAWLLLRSGSNLTLWGEHSFTVDILATAFILPFIVTLIVIPINRRKLAADKISAVALGREHWLEAALLRFPAGLAMRALYFGLVGMLIIAPVTLLPLWLLGIHEFTPLAYSIFKGFWAGAMAALLTPPMLLLALNRD